MFLLAAALLGAPAAAQSLDRQLQIAPVKPAAGERRLALVIGNSAYKTSPLRNPVNDARAIAKALAGTGFRVTVVEDASQAVMRRAMRSFGDELMNGGVGLFYYAGHGMQVRGKNYLIPVNADIEREDEVEDQAVDANVILSKMDSAKNSLNLMILDACRNNPFARSFRSAAQGLAQMDAPSGTLVAFATAPGSVAADGDGDNGLYTKHLLANLSKPGLAVEQLFKEVRIGVTRETKDRQVPWESSSLKGNFFFVPGEASISAEEQRRQIDKQVSDRLAVERAEQQKQMEKVIQQMLAAQKAALEEEMKKRAEAGKPAPSPAPAAAPAPAATFDRSQMELAFWESIKGSSNPYDFKAYLDQYPQGTFAALARSRAAARPAPAPVAAAPKPAAPASIAALKPLEPPRPAPGAPVQVASAAPTSMIGLGIDDPRYPKIGDLWEYRYTDVTSKQQRTARYEVTAVSKDGILEAGGFDGGNPSVRAFSANAELIHKDMWDFAPYLLSFEKPAAGKAWSNLQPQGGICVTASSAICRFDGKVAGAEKIRTPAGEFDTLKVVIDVNVSGMGTGWRQMTFWYAESVKRVVKATVRSPRPMPRPVVGMTYDYDFELTSYVPASQRTPASGVQLASAAPTLALGSGIEDPRYPKVGDYWDYRYVDVSSRSEKKARIQVVSVDKGAIAESNDGETPRSYGQAPKFLHNKVWLELNPYLGIFADLKPGQSWSSLPWENYGPCNAPSAGCRFEGKVEGTESISTKAGTFNAVKVLVNFNGRSTSASTSTPPGWRQLAFWYAPEVKRIVKATARVRSGITLEPDYDVELESFKLH